MAPEIKVARFLIPIGDAVLYCTRLTYNNITYNS